MCDTKGPAVESQLCTWFTSLEASSHWSDVKYVSIDIASGLSDSIIWQYVS